MFPILIGQQGIDSSMVSQFPELYGSGSSVSPEIAYPSSAPSFEGFDQITDSGAPTDYNFMEYLEGLLSSVGAENEINRLYNSAEAKANREFQSNEALLQRNWYEALSSSAYSRAMADMRNSGLNPILAYQQGGAASAGTGVASGSASSYNVGGGDTLTGVLNAVAALIGSIGSTVNGSKQAAASMFKALFG